MDTEIAKSGGMITALQFDTARSNSCALITAFGW
jgi:hypothetical protein